MLASPARAPSWQNWLAKLQRQRALHCSIAQQILSWWQSQDARTILAIHNMAHQGVEPAATFANLGVPDDMWASSHLTCQQFTISACAWIGPSVVGGCPAA
jgi:glycogen synthase